MASTPGTVEILLQEIGQALSLLQGAIQADQFASLLRDLGVDAPPDLSGDTQFVSKLSRVVNAGAAVDAALQALALAIDTGSSTDLLSASGQVLATCGEVSDALDKVAADLPRAAAGFPEVIALASSFTGRVVEEVISRYLELAHPLTECLLRLLGVIERVTVTLQVNGADTIVVRRRLFFDRLPKLLSDPIGVINLPYHWGDSQFDEIPLFQNLSDLFRVMGVLATGPEDSVSLQVGEPDDYPNLPPQADMLSVVVTKSSDVPPGLEAKLFMDIGSNRQIELVRVGDNWRFVIDLGGSYQNGLIGRLLPPAKLELVPPGTGVLNGRIGFQFIGQSPQPDGRVDVISVTSGCKVDAKTITAGVIAELAFDTNTHKATADLGFRFAVQGGRILVSQDPHSSDGFLSALLPEKGVTIDFDLGIKWTPSTGLVVEGGVGLDLSIPINRALGPLTVESLDIGAKLTTQAVSIGAGVSGACELGPITASVQGVGVRLAVDSGKRGALGNGDMTVKFKPPSGVGIKVDAGPVTGGGFLSLDFDAGRYAGAVELSVYSVAVKAFGIIDTKFPDGHKGFSFIIIISAEFNPVQLGFGFTLLGVGGIIGINRTLNADALRSVVRSHGLENVLFPSDPVGDAPAIIADLAAIFPPADGHYVFGPMAKLGWGTPTLIQAEIGVVLVLPGPVLAVLGEVHTVLPNAEFALVELNFAVVGVLDFPQKRFSLDASLHDSHIGDFPISGDMAMRINWGGDPNFALSIGGFHPAFKPPAGFPSLARVSVDLGRKGNPSLTLSGYMALTSNTAQIGARAELNASGSGIRLHGFIGFDALFVFSPFSFIANFDAGVSVTFHGHGIGVHVRGQLSGPSPWHVSGEVCVSILFWDACLSFSKDFGGSARVELPSLDPFLGSPSDAAIEAQEVVGLKNALQDPRNWSSVAPAGSFTAVALVSSLEGAPPLIDPMGAASLHQRVVPLNRPITLFAGAKPLGPGSYTIASVTLTGGVTTSTSIVQDDFAPAAFQKMSDAQKLSHRSFEKMDAGVNISTDNVTLGTVVPRNIVYNTIVIDPRTTTPPSAPDFTLQSRHLAGMTARSAPALAGLRVTGAERFVDPTAPIKVLLDKIQYVVALSSTLAAATGFSTSTSKSALTLAVEAAVQATASLAKQLQVIPTHEVA